MKKKIKMTPKRKELINNLSQTILKESKKANGVNKQLVEKLHVMSPGSVFVPGSTRKVWFEQFCFLPRRS